MSYDPYHRPGFQHPYGQPPPTVPGGQYPAQPPPASPSAPPARRPRWPYLALAGAVLFLAGAAYVAYDRNVIFKDSGIKACEAFRDNKTVDGAPVDHKADGKMTKDQYLTLRGVFQDSRYDDIRAAGTKMMDVLWQITNMGKDAGLEAFPLVGQMMSAITDMQGACANHGIVVDLTSKINKPAASASPSPAWPRCSDVFQPGKKIRVSGDTCTTASGGVYPMIPFDCADGGKLYQVDADSGAPAGWGRAGGTYVAARGDVNSDPKAAEAMQKCFG